MKLEFSQQISKDTQISKFMKILPAGVEVFQADRQTDMVKLVFAFRNFQNVPKKAPQILRNKIQYYFIRESKEILDIAARLRMDDQTI